MNAIASVGPVNHQSYLSPIWPPWLELASPGGSVEAMLALIGRLLEAHEAEARGPSDLIEVDLGRALAGAAARARARAERAGVRLSVSAPDSRVIARAEPLALDQILDNLVANAIQFSPAGSRIGLSAPEAPNPIVEVSDEGLGVPEDERDRLFGKFAKGSTRPIAGPRGSGLGLYIAHTLALSIGARVRYRPAPVTGSIFSVQFDGAIRSGP